MMERRPLVAIGRKATDQIRDTNKHLVNSENTYIYKYYQYNIIMLSGILDPDWSIMALSGQIFLYSVQ